MVPKIRQANMPTCHRTRRSQKGSSRAGPLGQLARLAFIDAKKACERPVPSVRAMLVGMDDGTIHPIRARTMTMGFRSNWIPSEISNSMRGAVLTVATLTGAGATRVETNATS